MIGQLQPRVAPHAISLPRSTPTFSSSSKCPLCEASFTPSSSSAPSSCVSVQPVFHCCLRAPATACCCCEHTHNTHTLVAYTAHTPELLWPFGRHTHTPTLCIIKYSLDARLRFWGTKILKRGGGESLELSTATVASHCLCAI
jgi:hypothetical protein